MRAFFVLLPALAAGSLMLSCAPLPPKDGAATETHSGKTASASVNVEVESEPNGLTSAKKSPRTRKQKLDSIPVWRARGKVAFASPDESGSASLDWRQQGGQSELRLYGPLGVGSTRIVPDGEWLRIEREGIERLYPANAAPWLSSSTALPIPIESIPFWLRGLPDPYQTDQNSVIEDGLIRSLEQAGWLIEFDRYDEFSSVFLPRRISLSNQASGLTLRLFIRRWDLSPDR
ncbi:MAG: lipoprotein insertase outer membrane protein LolB [Pseudomonadota bacterium]